MVNLASVKDSAAQWFLQASSILGSLGITSVKDFHSDCSALQSINHIENTTILHTAYYSADEGITHAPIQVVPLCYFPTFHLDAPTASAPVCRVRFRVNTTETSSVTAEVWLPSDWNGRFLSVGNGGLGGCIDYRGLDYGTSLGCVTVGGNNGHDGQSGEPFLNNPEVFNDFAHRSIHVQTVAGKQIAQAFYKQNYKKSYYLGCSTGGRQGMMSALRYPEDFDGIVAGAPAVNFNKLIGFDGMLSRYVGAPNATGKKSPSFIPRETWKIVNEEILRQCDELDGLKDGIITEPDNCDFRPEQLLCDGSWLSAKKCLTVAQVEALKRIYSPMYDSHGNLLMPRFDPGTEVVERGLQAIFHGEIFPLTEEWYKYVIYNDTTYDVENFGLKDIEIAAAMDPGGVTTFSGDMSAFKARGGKLLTYHGRTDELIPSGISKAFYDLISRTLNMPTLDSFYRLFLVPGMEHCFAGPPNSAFRFGQHDVSQGPTSTGRLPSHNILLALVDWVEKGVAPEVIVGTSDAGVERKHCRYPWKSVWNKDSSTFGCVP